jgi:hypothetical protein
VNTDKIRDIISEIEEEIRVREEALTSLRRLMSNGTSKAASQTAIEIKASDNLVLTDSLQTIMFGHNESYVDLAVKLIKASSRPLSVSEIVGQIRTLKNNPQIERRSVEATLHQHVAKSQTPRLTRVSPGIYGLTARGDITPA